MRVLALSSSKVGDGIYLAAAVPMIKSFLAEHPLQIAFVPFAAVDGDYQSYAGKVRDALSALPHTIHVVQPGDAKAVIHDCNAVMIGGGNTFKLLHDIYQYDLFGLIQEKVKEGCPYIGWSAGANLTGKTICTTNDMPIIQPHSFTAFEFLPFQVNPHYYNVVIEGHHGETRDQRLTEFLLLNPNTPVVGLPEGTALQLWDEKLQLIGTQNAVLFTTERRAINKQTISPGEVALGRVANNRL